MTPTNNIMKEVGKMSKLTKQELEHIKEYNLGNFHDSYELTSEPKRLLKEAVLRGYIKPVAFHSLSYTHSINIVCNDDDYVFGYFERYRAGGGCIKDGFFKVKVRYHAGKTDNWGHDDYFYFLLDGVKYRFDELMSCY